MTLSERIAICKNEETVAKFKFCSICNEFKIDSFELSEIRAQVYLDDTFSYIHLAVPFKDSYLLGFNEVTSIVDCIKEYYHFKGLYFAETLMYLVISNRRNI